MMHPTVKLHLPGPKRAYADIDKDLAPMITTLWRCRIPTVHCCQGDADEGRLAYICFLELSDAELFIVAAGIEGRYSFHRPRTAAQGVAN